MRVNTQRLPTILAFHKPFTTQERVERPHRAILRLPDVPNYLAPVAMQSPRSSSGTNVAHLEALPDYLSTINQLSAKVQEHERLLQGMNLVNSQVLQSVFDLQHQALWTDYLQKCDVLARHQQQMSLEHAQQYGTLCLLQGPSPTDVLSQQVHQEQPASVATTHHHHHHYQAVSMAEEVLNSAVHAPQQVKYCYAPHILNAHEVEQGKYTPATVLFQEDAAVQSRNAVISPSAAVAFAANTDPVLNVDINSIHFIEIPAQITWNPWETVMPVQNENRPHN